MRKTKRKDLSGKKRQAWETWPAEPDVEEHILQNLIPFLRHNYSCSTSNAYLGTGVTEQLVGKYASVCLHLASLPFPDQRGLISAPMTGRSLLQPRRWQLSLGKRLGGGRMMPEKPPDLLHLLLTPSPRSHWDFSQSIPLFRHVINKLKGCWKVIFVTHTCRP